MPTIDRQSYQTSIRVFGCFHEKPLFWVKKHRTWQDSENEDNGHLRIVYKFPAAGIEWCVSYFGCSIYGSFWKYCGCLIRIPKQFVRKTCICDAMWVIIEKRPGCDENFPIDQQIVYLPPTKHQLNELSQLLYSQIPLFALCLQISQYLLGVP